MNSAGSNNTAELHPEELVFICHSSQNHELAVEVCRYLEGEGIPCWIAPRDISGGQSYASAILGGLAHARAVVLLLSREAQSSPHVLREIERAVHRRVPIIPLLIDSCNLEGDLEYFLSPCQWIDLNTCSSRYEAFEQLRYSIVGAGPCASTPSAAGPQVDVQTSPKQKEATTSDQSKSHLQDSRLLLIGLLLLALVAAGFLWEPLSKLFQSDSYPSITTAHHPAAGTTILGPVLRYSWDAKVSEGHSVSYEIKRWNLHKPTEPLITKVAKPSYVEEKLRGGIGWQVRASWKLDDSTVVGKWSKPQEVFHYRDSLDRIRLTGKLRVGLTTQDAQVRDQGIGGFELAALKLFVRTVSPRADVSRNDELIYQVVPWGDDFFKLAHDEDVDVLASGISISPEREERYGIRFTHPFMTYPQVLICRIGCSTPYRKGKIHGLEKLAVARGTTNESFATKVQPGAGFEIKFFEGTEVYATMISELIQHRVDAVLLDLPYAHRWQSFFLEQGIRTELYPLTEDLVVDAPLEKVGFALRPENEQLRLSLNEFLQSAHSDLESLRASYLGPKS